jgi:hypothetical protein
VRAINNAGDTNKATLRQEGRGLIAEKRESLGKVVRFEPPINKKTLFEQKNSSENSDFVGFLKGGWFDAQ